MAQPGSDTPNIAVFADYENVALGARDAKFDKFDINLVLERLLERGNVVVRKAYCDWSRYKSDRVALHERSFELVEVPHVKLAGKNSADIRMVVDALDLAHTKRHVGVFALITGDSDFSPLVSKLRENNKAVIGIGVRQSTSDLLVENCDEFIYYDDLIREHKPKRPRAKVEKREPKATGNGGSGGGKSEGQRKAEAIELTLDTVEAMFRDRSGTLWGSMVKQAIQRKRPNFSESYHGYRSFNQLLEDAEQRELLVLQKDEKSGGYIIVELGAKA
ncbi:NYN domain-containing protein [Enhygromyxa salina]|uniref:NYN domain protein n=1 Tax=Enhygromyxa salina TaxID=215803 RepID=A0A2S9YXL2_9BACT|nr:NYN domain-containing protein [Enhygromyxa salina]PRQ09820.1 NYN domain protein [Enhygromyxa salina]